MDVTRKVQSKTLSGPAGRLEALWEEPSGARTDLAGLVCHPHPLYGGTLHNKVVHHISLALQERGLPVLRFNFRGAGKSEGKHDRGRGEGDDVRAALDWIASERPKAGIVLAGFSFGAWVGLRVGCQDERVHTLIGVGLPVDSSELDYLAGCAKPKLLVQGSRDQYGSKQNLERALNGAAGPKELLWIEDADHFFVGHLVELRRTIVDHFPST